MGVLHIIENSPPAYGRKKAKNTPAFGGRGMQDYFLAVFLAGAALAASCSFWAVSSGESCLPS